MGREATRWRFSTRVDGMGRSMGTGVGIRRGRSKAARQCNADFAYSNGSQRLRPSRGVRTPDGVQIWGAGPFFPHNALISKELKGLRVKNHALHFLVRHHCPRLNLH